MSTKIFVWQGRVHGGAERITLEVARYLVKHGYSVTLGLYQADTALTLSDPALIQLELPVPTWVPGSFKSLYASVSWRWQYGSQFAAVYAHTLGYWKINNNHLFIHDAADLDIYHAHSATVWHGLASKIWRQLYLSLSLRPATLLLSASRDFTRYLDRHGISETKIKASGSFYDETIFHSASSTPAAAPLKLPQPPYRLTFIGNTEDPRKNFSLLRQAFYGQPDWQLEIFGSPHVQQDQNFNYHGYVTPTQLAQALQTADLFIMPSRGEGFSIALLEALATGIPCLVNEAAVNPELANIHNLVTFKIQGDQPQVELVTAARHILTQYPYYAGVDPEILHFSQKQMLAQELMAMRPYLDANGTASETKLSA